QYEICFLFLNKKDYLIKHMQIDVITIFPNFFDYFLDHSIIKNENKEKEEEARKAEEERLREQRENKGKGIAEASGEIEESRAPFILFVNELAREKYQEVLKRDFLFERGFGSDFPKFLESGIMNLGWRKFCAKPEPVNSNIVREFYANLDVKNYFELIIPGVPVQWSPEAINELFDLQDFPHAVFNEMVDGPSCDQLSAAFREVGIEGAQWRVSQTRKHTFQVAYLKSEANTWMGFIRLRLLPTTHDSTVSRDRVLLAFAILRSMSIDVGKIISSDIVDCWKKKVGKLFFPNTITMLCSRA
ncbi:MAG: hypothetical protein Q8835_02830, partial [Sweet potato little leaf phytoplasma]|nr:hypothetical protein [Sweet potato little leaf phytoplasma]